MIKNKKKQRRQRIHRRVRARITGTKERPRLSIYKSSRHIYAQLIDDVNGTTLLASSTREAGLQDEFKEKKPLEKATVIGKNIAEKAKEKKIERITFDRSGYAYHGIISAIADGAREGGLNF